MKSIWKKTTGSPSANDKVGDYNFKEHYPTVNRNTAWGDLEPYIRQATRKYLIPVIGEDLYNDIADMVQAGTTLNDAQKEFLERLRDAAAHQAIAIALPKIKTLVSSMGAVENNATENTTGSSLWGFKTTLWAVAQDADRLTDELLSYLEERVKANDINFDLWKDSDAYTVGKSDYFRITADFQQYQNINNSRRTFIAMLPIMKQVVKTHILPIIGQEQHDALVEQVATNNVSDNNKPLLDSIRSVLAAWTVHYAADKLTILPDQDGFSVITNTQAIDQRAYSQEVMLAAIERIRSAAEKDARTNTAELINQLHIHSDWYPLWVASTANPDNQDWPNEKMICTDHGAIML